MKSIATNPDIVISISCDRLGKDRYGMKHGYKGKKRRYESIYDLLHEEKKLRTFWSPGITLDIFKRTVPINYRFNVPVGVDFPQAAGRRFGAIVESLGAVPAQIVVERAMYWDAAGQHWAAGTNALAAKLP